MILKDVIISFFSKQSVLIRIYGKRKKGWSFYSDRKTNSIESNFHFLPLFGNLHIVCFINGFEIL